MGGRGTGCRAVHGEPPNTGEVGKEVEEQVERRQVGMRRKQGGLEWKDETEAREGGGTVEKCII